MNTILIVGIIVSFGFLCGEIAKKIKLPKVTGYILAGVLLNPGLFHIIPRDFVNHMNPITNLALSFITFAIGGSLLGSKIKKLGKAILSITFFEAEGALLTIILGFLIITPFFLHIPNATWAATFIPVSLFLGALGAPTDPSATLAVIHEYKVKGDVSSTMMGVSALDDVFGIINYCMVVVIAGVLIRHETFTITASFIKPLLEICGSITLGIAFGYILNIMTLILKRETEGAFIVMILALLALCFGLATLLGIDQLLATMTMGIIVVNFNTKSQKIFDMLERYTDELIFVLFFTLSGMFLDFSVLASSFILVVFFVIFRTTGKLVGTAVGAIVGSASDRVRKYTAGGLMPQGGIVVGLALMIKQNHAFDAFSDIVISIIIGTTILYEFVGPITAKLSLKKAGEI